MKLDDGGTPMAPDPEPEVKVTVNNDQNRGDPGLGDTSFMTRPIPLPEKDVWFKTYWRPAAAWLYLFINLFDFVLAPALGPLVCHLSGIPYTPWVPLTTSGGAVFHLSFGAIIGVTAWGRTREKVSGINLE